MFVRRASSHVTVRLQGAVRREQQAFRLRAYHQATSSKADEVFLALGSQRVAGYPSFWNEIVGILPQLFTTIDAESVELRTPTIRISWYSFS